MIYPTIASAFILIIFVAGFCTGYIRANRKTKKELTRLRDDFLMQAEHVLKVRNHLSETNGALKAALDNLESLTKEKAPDNQG